MNEYKVTVIVPVYNTAPYVCKCIESLLGQTHTNLEIIIVNDGSTDDSGEICKKYATLDGRIKLINKANGGVSSARNAAIDVMTGEFLTFLDSDDWFDENAIENLLCECVDYDVDMVIFNSMLEYPGKAVPRTKKTFTGLANKRKLIEQTILPQSYYLNSQCKFYRVESLLNDEGKVNKFDETVKVLEDGLWLLPNLLRVKIGFIDNRTWYHRTMREDSVMGNEDNWLARDMEYHKSFSRLLEILELESDSYLFKIASNSCLATWRILLNRAAIKNRLDLTPELLLACGEKYALAFIGKELSNYYMHQSSTAYRVIKKLNKNKYAVVILKIIRKLYRR